MANFIVPTNATKTSSDNYELLVPEAPNSSSLPLFTANSGLGQQNTRSAFANVVTASLPNPNQRFLSIYAAPKIFQTNEIAQHYQNEQAIASTGPQETERLRSNYRQNIVSHPPAQRFASIDNDTVGSNETAYQEAIIASRLVSQLPTDKTPHILAPQILANPRDIGVARATTDFRVPRAVSLRVNTVSRQMMLKSINQLFVYFFLNYY